MSATAGMAGLSAVARAPSGVNAAMQFSLTGQTQNADVRTYAFNGNVSGQKARSVTVSVILLWRGGMQSRFRNFRCSASVFSKNGSQPATPERSFFPKVKCWPSRVDERKRGASLR